MHTLLLHIFNVRPNWCWTDGKPIKFNKTLLDFKLKEIVFPQHLLLCNNIYYNKHIADIENIYSLIVNGCIISTPITVQYIYKNSSLKSKT